MKKLLAFLLIAAVIATSLFAKGQTESASEASLSRTLTGTLKIWSPLSQASRAEALEKLGKDFEAANPGVKVEITVMPWSGIQDKILAAIMAGNAPDIAIVGQGHPQTLASGLAEVSDLVDFAGGKDNFLGTSLLLGSTEDGCYALPLYITPVVAYYRQSYLDKAGITKLPETWEEYYEMCRAVTDPGNNIYGFGVPFGDQHGTKTVWQFLLSNDVELVAQDKNGEWYITDDADTRARMAEVYNFLYRLVRDCAPKGIGSYTQTNVRELVSNGTIMSRIDTPEIYNTVAKMDPENMKDVKYFKIPGNKAERYYMGWVGWAIPENAENVDLAKAFLEFCYSEDRLVPFYNSYPHAMFPAVKSLFNNEGYRENLPEELKPIVPDLALDILDKSAAITMANGPFPAAGSVEQSTILGDGVMRMLNEGITAEKAVDDVIAKLKALL